MATGRPLFSIGACSRFTDAASLAALTLSPMATTTLVSPGRSLCTQIGRVGDGAPGVRARCRRGTGFLPGRILGIFHPENSARRLNFLSNWGVYLSLVYLNIFFFNDVLRSICAVIVRISLLQNTFQNFIYMGPCIVNRI